MYGMYRKGGCGGGGRWDGGGSIDSPVIDREGSGHSQNPGDRPPLEIMTQKYGAVTGSPSRTACALGSR